jgi:CelD/BcsL family acetyltransferase involved in cellulose biosynthesis
VSAPRVRVAPSPSGPRTGDRAPTPVRVLRGRDEVGRVLDLAGDLLDATGAPICARPLWLRTWFEAFPGVRPVAVVAGAAGRVDGLACLAVTRQGPLRTVMLAGAGPSDAGRLPTRDPAAVAALAAGVGALLREIRGPWRLHLAQLPVADPMVEALLATVPGAYVEDGQGCPQLTFGPDRALAQHISTSGRRAGRQARNGIAKAGLELRVDRIAEPEQVRGLLPALVALRRDRDHWHGRRSDLDDPGQRGFYAGVISRLAAAGQVEISTLRLDGTLASYLVGLRDGPVFRNWDGRISSDWPALSPGRLLRDALLAALLEDPAVSRIDWGRGEQQHKMSAVTEVLPHVALRAESSPRVTAALRAATRLRRSVRALVPDDLLRRVRRRRPSGRR